MKKVKTDKQIKSENLWIGGFILFCIGEILAMILFMQDTYYFIGFNILYIPPLSLYIYWGYIICRSEDVGNEVAIAGLVVDANGFALCEPCGMYHDETNMAYREDNNTWICKQCLSEVV